MKLLSPIIFSLIIFCVGMFYFKLTTWLKLRKFTHIIKGTVDDIKIIDEKLFFIIKWTIPEKLRNINPGNELENGLQYYHHFIAKVPKFNNKQKESEYVNHFLNKHNGRVFYLKAHLDNGVIRDLTALESPGNLVLLFGLSILGLSYLYLKLNNFI